MTDDYSTTYLDNLRVSQARIHAGSADWWVVNASGYEIRGPFADRAEAEDNLADLRAPEDEDDGEPIGAGADPFGRPDPRTHPEFWTE